MKKATLVLLAAPALVSLTCSRPGGGGKPAPPAAVDAAPIRFVQMFLPKEAHQDAVKVTKYDDAEFHSESVAEAHLPEANAATHIGLFLAWAIMRDLTADDPELAADRANVKRRKLTGARFLLRNCDGKFLSSDLNDEGSAFADAYYGERYMDDYDRVLAKGLLSEYHVEDSWKNFDAMAPVIDRRFAAWKKERAEKRRLPRP